jgi:carbamoylphosphate synthase small subunit
MLIDYKSLKDTVASTRSTSSRLESQISIAEAAVTRRTREKGALETNIPQLNSTIQLQKSAQSTQRAEINKASTARAEVTLLQNITRATATSVEDVAAQLLRLKQALNECVAVLDAGNIELHVKTFGLRQVKTTELTPKAGAQAQKGGHLPGRRDHGFGGDIDTLHAAAGS